MDIRDIFRVGKVSSVNASNCTARVTFPDKDDLVSQELPIIVIGLCCFLPNASGRGMNTGFILGAFYSAADPPEENNKKVRCLKVPDGSYIKFEGNGNVEIHATGNLKLTGARIDLN